MPYKQKNSSFQSQFHQEQREGTHISRQRQLVLTWQEQKVNDSYQSMVLNYLDTLSNRELRIEIQKQLQRFHNKSSFYHKVQYLIQERQRALDILYESIEQMNSSIEKDSHFSYDLQKICDCIDHVRKTSMLISESVWEMFQQFKFKPGNKSNASLGKRYICLFQHFDDDLAFLRESLMKYYISFSQNFDPLLLEAAKPLKRFYNEKKLVYNQNVDELFRINASYLYRLLRAHQRILSNYILSKDLQANLQKQEIQLLQYSPKKTSEHYSSSPDNQPQEKPNFAKQKIIPYNLSQPSKKKPIKLQRQRYISQVLAPIKQQPDKPKRLQLNLEGRKNQNASKDNRKITRIADITINNSKQSLRSVKKSRIAFTNQRQNESQEENDLPKNLISTSQSKREKTSSLSANKRTITQSIELKKSKPSSKNQFIPQKNPYSQRAQNIESQNQNLENSPYKHKQLSRMEERAINRKHSRSLHLPKLTQLDEHHLHDKSSDCLCRQKYKSRKLKQSYVNIPPEEVEEKRQTIIKKVNQKYKQLAKKQIRYELSMLGDVTYHKMKQKVLHSRINQRQHKNKTPNGTSIHN